MCQVLIELHNNGKIDFVSGVKDAEHEPKAGRAFWNTVHLFSKIAPSLETPIDLLIIATDRLVVAAGDDLAGNQPNTALREWLKLRPDETAKMLDSLKAGEDEHLPILTFVLEAGATHDLENYHAQAITFLSDTRRMARASAATALSRIDASMNEEQHQSGLRALSEYVSSASTPEDLTQAVRALLENYAREYSMAESEILKLLQFPEHLVSPQLHYQLAFVLGHYHQKLPVPVQIAIITALGEADPAMKGVIDQIDYAFSSCIHSGNRLAVAGCVQKLLDHDTTPLKLEDLDSFVHKLSGEETETLAWLVVYWLRHGSHATRMNLGRFFRRYATEGFELDADLSTFAFSDAELLFISRKVIGFFVIEATTAASLLVACLDAVNEQDTAEKIANLLFDPLMINYPGQVRDFVERKVSEGAHDLLAQAIQSHDVYLEGLRSIPELPELWPSPSQRQIQADYQAKQMATAFRDAKSKSVLMEMVSTQILLHGAGSATYFKDHTGQLRRMESMMSSQGTSIEVPRFEALDPVKFQHLILQFRNEIFDQ